MAIADGPRASLVTGGRRAAAHSRAAAATQGAIGGLPRWRGRNRPAAIGGGPIPTVGATAAGALRRGRGDCLGAAIGKLGEDAFSSAAASQFQAQSRRR